MGELVLKRFLTTLLALVFIGANLPASCVGASTMETAAAMTAVIDHPCVDCSGSAPPTDLAKMVCGALACAGIIGLPLGPTMVAPDVREFLHLSSAADEISGISIKPDPFPPKPVVRA